jgi:predicted Zn-dependent protease
MLDRLNANSRNHEQRDPPSPEWWGRIARLDDLWRGRRYDESRQLIADLGREHPEHPAFKLAKGRQLMLDDPEGQTASLTQRVRQLVEEAVAQDTDDVRALAQATIMMFELGDEGTCRDYAQRLLPRLDELMKHEVVPLNYVFGGLAIAAGKPEAAEEPLRFAFEQERHVPAYGVALARLLFSLGRRSEATAVLDRALRDNPHDLELQRLRLEPHTTSATTALPRRWSRRLSE